MTACVVILAVAEAEDADLAQPVAVLSSAIDCFLACDCLAVMQTAFYFGYMAVVCYAFLLMLGTVGFRASLFFVRYAAQLS